MKKTIDIEKVEQVLKLHQLWLNNEPGGKKAVFAKEYLEGINLSERSLSRVDFFEANLAGANLAGANLAGANLANARFVNARLQNANLEGANLEAANLRGANLAGAGLEGANLEYASLKGANLEYASLKGANLESAYLIDARLRGANLEGATVIDATLTGANLRGASLVGANLGYANLENARLIGADLEGARLKGATLAGANLVGACLRGANLTGATVTDATLTGANLEGASLVGANLEYANLENARLIGADLLGASLVDADLEGARLKDANLKDTNLTDANLTGANLTDVDLTSIFLGGANLSGAIFKLMDVKRAATGVKRKGVKALKKVTQPMKVAAFKKAFPEGFETIKHDIGGGTLDPAAATKLIDSYGLVWLVTKTKWTETLQRLSNIPNDVLQLNVDLALLTDDKEMLDTIEAIRKTLHQSQHPVLRHGPLTIGWVRYSVFEDEGVLLIEEVQSDMSIVRKGLSDKEFQAEMKRQGLTEDRILAALDLLEPFIVRFYEDALSLIFDIAEEMGISVEMLTYEQKGQFGSPRSLYEKLPKSMGMKKVMSFKSPVEGTKMWQVTPNSRRPSIDRIPDKFAWRRQA